MKLTRILALGAIVVALGAARAAVAAPLYTQNFDADDTPNWTVNNNGIGTNAANVFYDYSTVGIPSAPHSSGGSTRGLKLGANLATAPASGIPGITASPTGKTFAGNYSLRFDWWENYIGPLNVGATGSTMVGEFGVLSSGTAANYPGVAESVFFAATGDGQSATDYRIYSPERPASYQIFPASGNALDAHATYPAASQNSSAALYSTLFPAGAVAPGIQATDPAFAPTQTSSTPAGAAGFRWHDVTIAKVGNLVTWTVDGTILGSVDMTLFGASQPGGTNILFGHADTNSTTNASATLLAALQFTLIDNVVVNAVPEPGSLALVGLASLAAVACGRRRR